MPSRELSRLHRLKLDSMDEKRLRAELRKTIENLGQEDQQNERLKAEAKQTSAALRDAIRREEALKRANSDLMAEVARFREEVDKLKAALEAASRETSSPNLPKGVQVKLDDLEFENARLTARVSAANKLVEQLQAAQDGRRKEQPAIRTRDLFRKFADEVETATKAMEGEFDVGDVEVEVRGAMGLEGNEVVMGLDHKQAITGETATRIKFSLHRRGLMKPVE